MAGAAALVAAAILYAIDTHALRIFQVPLSALLVAAAGLGALGSAWRRMR
jgi:hypothetical protein